MKKCIITLVLSFLFPVAVSSLYAEPIQNPSNGHWYSLASTGGEPLDWFDARNYAASLSYNGLPGHLVTVTSSQEANFIKANFFPFDGSNEIHVWIGGSQLSGQSQPNAGWRWITGETWSFLDWDGGEPNDCCNPPDEEPQETDDENCLEYKEDPSGNVAWNDAPCGSRYDLIMVEYERPQAIPTMTEWGMIIMSLVLAITAIWMIRRRKIA